MRLAAAIILLFATTAQAGGYHYPVQRSGGYVRTAPAGTTFTNSPFNPVNNITTLNFSYHIQNPGPVAQVGQTLTYSAFTEPVAYRIQAQLDSASRTVEQLPETLRQSLGLTLQTAKEVNVFQESRLLREQKISQVERLVRASENGTLLGQSVSLSVQSNQQPYIPQQQQQAPPENYSQQPAPQDVPVASKEIIDLTTTHCGRCHGQGGNAVQKFNMSQLSQLSAKEWQYVGISITGGGVAEDGREIPAMPKDDFHSFKYADKMRLLDLIRGK